MIQRIASRSRTGLTALACGLVVALGQAAGSPAVLVPAGSAPATVAAPVAASPDRPAPLEPNLVVLPARDVHVRWSGGQRRLRFESGLGNIGEGPIEVRPDRVRECPEGQQHATQVMFRDLDGNGRFQRHVDTRTARRSAGCMVFHPYHDHWHFEAASRYTLFRADRPERSKVATRKMSFCLRDSRPLPERYDTRRHPEYYGACSRYSPQGISVGWVDVYQSFLAGQAITLPHRMGDGLYCLQIMVDPRNALVETHEDDNTSIRAFSLRGDTVTYRERRRCRGLAG